MRSEITWQKSSYSGGGDNCVEIAAHADVIWLRESDQPNVIAAASRHGFAALLTGVRSGRFGQVPSA
ncbi:DUF397 domain-containing protein [Streptomyces triculaminicus]|uniref:DUF397 domain-containing protein n=1 Tax=Streptomyces triculaminicus TaxID=2816232 RepID=UPI0037D8FDEB